MTDNKNHKAGTTRKEFIKRTTKGTLGIAMGGYLWPGFTFGKRHTTALNVLNTIAFGSCARQDKPQSIWDAVIRKNPDLFLFLGDNIYGDTADMKVLEKKYQKLAAKPGYQRLLKTCPVLSTWDDHDYGKNDAGVEYTMKRESEQIFMDFFDIPQESPRRSRSGVYGSYLFGPEGKRLQVILLDTRYFKDTSGRKKDTMTEAQKKQKNIVGWYLPSDNTSSTLLGPDQWQWLEDELKKEADLRIICSSVQFVAYEKGMESWGNYPHERQRMIDLIRETEANGAFFVSGDVHFSELSRSREGEYPLYDFTCSGLTHSNKGWSQAINNFRIGDAYAGKNAGFIEIDWDAPDPTIHFKTIAENGQVMIHQEVNKSELMV